MFTILAFLWLLLMVSILGWWLDQPVPIFQKDIYLRYKLPGALLWVVATIFGTVFIAHLGSR